MSLNIFFANSSKFIDTKRCTRCGVEKIKTTDYFYKDKKLKSGLSSMCKNCSKKYDKKRREESKEKDLIIAKQKRKQNKDKLFKCSKCGIQKKLSENNFRKKRRSTTGFQTFCIECEKKNNKKNRDINKKNAEKNRRKYKNILKKCNICGFKKKLNKKNFNKNGEDITGFSNTCKECRSKKRKKIYQKNKDEVQKNNLERKIEIINKSKRIYCEVCGCTDPKLISWHHLNPENKLFNISEALDYTKKYSDLDLLNEIKKCQILCNNCHQKIHKINFDRESLKRQPTKLKKTLKIYNYKKENPCLCCNLSDPDILVYHHRDPASKLFQLSLGERWSYQEIEEEIKKCDILCVNCHKYIHSLLGRTYKYYETKYKKTIEKIKTTPNLWKEFLK